MCVCVHVFVFVYVFSNLVRDQKNNNIQVCGRGQGINSPSSLGTNKVHSGSGVWV